MSPKIENVEIYINSDGSVDFADFPLELESVKTSLESGNITSRRKNKDKPLITLITDFGLRDHFVGVMKGIIHSICPEAMIIDISHDIGFADIKHGAFTLMASYKYFPAGTIFVCVVDPGVGSERKPILIKTNDYIFIGPDNGIFSYALSRETVEKVIHISNHDFFLESVSNTFHGRDIFAPVSAHVAQGVEIDTLGESVSDYINIQFPKPVIKKKQIVGEIVTNDRFGNIITNITPDMIKKKSCLSIVITCHDSINKSPSPLMGEDKGEGGKSSIPHHLTSSDRGEEYGEKEKILLNPPLSKEENKMALTNTLEYGEKDVCLINRISSSYSESEEGELLAIWGSSGLLEISVNKGSAMDVLSKSGKTAIKIYCNPNMK